MLRNLDWIHDLDLRYDSSTFDTDPFELQPEGAGTIFPFWVAAPEAREARSAKRQEESAEALSQAARAQGKETEAPVQGRNTLGAYRLPLSAQPPYPLPLSAGFASSLPSPRSGYVELPYTLPQDSTLFLLLREKSPEIWLRKLDWIAAHGGMALVNVHPDYMDFAGTHRVNREYAATMYAELLRHVAEKHAGQFWNPLPKDLTTWFNGARCSTMRQGTAAAVLSGNIGRRGSSRVAGLRGKRAAVLLYSYYPSDPRPRRAAEAMIEAGMEVDLLCLSKDGSESPQELVNGVRVFRMPMKRRRESIWTYFRQYSRFLVASFWFLTRRDLRRRYDLIHVHNMPDALVFAALVPKLRGARIILDLHDPMPELMMSIYGLDPHEWSVRLLRRLERWSIRFANLVLTPNITFKNLFVSRSCPPEKLQIVMNSPQQEIFDSARLGITRPPGRNGTAFRIMHHGLIAHRHGIDLLVEAVARVRSSIPGVRLDIYGARTPFLDTVLAATDRLGVADIVHYHGEKTQADIARAIQESDLGVVPNRSSPFTELNFPTRIFEYLAMHRPVLAPATQGIKDYFSEDQLLMFEPGNVDDLTARILWIREHPDAARDLVTRGLEVYRQYLWQKERARFLDLLTATVR
jgi:glycosyltransferase involved in cell wall biosynthesis